MGHIRQRDPQAIRERAIETAVKKYADGCDGCAASYLRLAGSHGATLDDVTRVVRQRGGLSRRDFLRFASIALASIAAGGALLLGARTANAANVLDQLTPGAISVPGYFGVDGCTTPDAGASAGMPLQFYIAELGATNYDAGCFMHDTFVYVGADYTHGYWGVSGPNLAPDPANLHSYGAQQALLALAAWKDTPGVGGLTIFADIESGFGGWGDPATPAQNAALLDGFLTTIASAGYTPGVYINNYDRDTWFPASYTPATPFVYWVAGGPQAGTMCAPCAQGCDTPTPVYHAWANAVSRETFAGQAPVLWQYWLSGMGCAGDFNYSHQSGYHSFSPRPITTQSVASSSSASAAPASPPSPPSIPTPSRPSVTQP